MTDGSDDDDEDDVMCRLERYDSRVGKDDCDLDGLDDDDVVFDLIDEDADADDDVVSS
jgi:hypothetical protein